MVSKEQSKASVAIFKKSVDYNDESVTAVPDEVFEAAKRVAESKITEVLRLRDGFYVLQYSLTKDFCLGINNSYV